MADQPLALDGRIRTPGPAGSGAAESPVRIALGEGDFTLATPGAPALVAAYRDLTTLSVQPGATLLVLGEGAGEQRLLIEGLGERQSALVRGLRERRTRQRLSDRMIRPDPDPIELVEYRSGGEHGVAELIFQPWAAELVPVDERVAPLHLRRAEIGAVEASVAQGTLRVERGGTHPLELLGLGASATRLQQRFAGLRDGAATDAARLLAALLPDSSFATRRHLGSLLVDGRPASVADLGADASPLEAAVLSEPTFAESYRALVARSAADPAAPRWFAMAPSTPGGGDARAWFFVALPGNLVALELVSPGAHATYLFRVVPRSAYAGEAPSALATQLAGAVSEISNALIDARFLREPMALPADQLASAAYSHYRLALAALPALAGARGRFVARLVHDDATRWGAALDALIAWHAAARDDAAEWPGRSAEEAAIGGDAEAQSPAAGQPEEE
jgi:hypothetical protein